MIALLRRDLSLAVRAGGGFGLGVAFFLILCALVPFGVGPDTSALQPIAPGILWLGALLACLLSLDRVFALDHEDGSLDLLATSPLPLEGAVAVKALAHWITTGLPLILAAPLFGILQDFGIRAVPIDVDIWSFPAGVLYHRAIETFPPFTLLTQFLIEQAARLEATTGPYSAAVAAGNAKRA